MKKAKQPGENISLKTKKGESPYVMEWINSQTNLMDSIRYLIENEIHRNGIRNLQNFIPADRNLEMHFSSGDVDKPAIVPGIEHRLEQGMNHGIDRVAEHENYREPAVSAEHTDASKTVPVPEQIEDGIQDDIEDEIDDEDIESWT